jgi:MFS family permease
MSLTGVSRWRRPYYGWVLVFTLGATETITWGILYYGFAVFMPAMQADLGWSRGEMSGAFGLALLLSGLFAFPVGRWLDRHGARLLMTVGSLAGVVLVLAWSQVQTIPQFYLLWLCIGIVMAAVLYEPAFAVVTAWFERQRTRALTAVTLMAGFASTIFMPIENWLIEIQGWRMALVTLAVVLALTTVLPHGLLLRRRPEDLGLHPDGAAEPTHSPGPHQSSSTSLRGLLGDPVFRYLAIAFSLTSMVALGVHIHMVAYLQDRGFDPIFAATAAGLVGAMQVLGRIGLGLLGDRVSLRVNAAVFLGLLPLGLLVLLLAPNTLGVLGAIALFGASKGAATILRPSYVAALYGRTHYGSIAGALAALVIVSNALGPFVTGAAYDAVGSYDLVLWVFVGLSLAAAAAAARQGGGRPRSGPGPGPER